MPRPSTEPLCCLRCGAVLAKPGTDQAPFCGWCKTARRLSGEDRTARRWWVRCQRDPPATRAD